ncbi:ssDNA/RNA exonuclease TatD [Seminavis robusta]|uniref:SsDNA/RNA exonuclease TatD n=1 Tax=Seminavis robusta TaxID=568900 RepID=A0A9N8HAW9_9STRA|nr:ssDNA/RNA exonuclease TatD [Seminavis robusta]|eukprot:Sro257_g100790.1 ssDNA/RNA exonuclease TatD (299) ;mRNA; f:9041-9937
MTTPTATTTQSSPPLVDIGINLTHKQFHRDREDVIHRGLEQANVRALILTGTSVKASQEAQQYCATAQSSCPDVQLYCTAGVHPHDAKRCNDDTTIESLRRLASTDQVVAIGECGLDHNRNFSPPDVQRHWFVQQLELARELQLPVFLHERDAHADFFQILSQYADKLPASIVHCFTGTQDALNDYLSLPNCYIGITGWVCDERRGLALRKIVPLIPDDRLMIETDAPFLYPRDLPPDRRTSKKDRRNEPAYLNHICDSVAACRGQTSEHLAKITTANAVRFFRLPMAPPEEASESKE